MSAERGTPGLGISVLGNPSLGTHGLGTPGLGYVLDLDIFGYV